MKIVKNYSILSGYRDGYFAALQDILNFTDTYSADLQFLYKSGKYNVLLAIIRHLLVNGGDLDRMIETGWMDELRISVEGKGKKRKYIVKLEGKDGRY